jgi:hypothetical protein
MPQSEKARFAACTTDSFLLLLYVQIPIMAESSIPSLSSIETLSETVDENSSKNDDENLIDLSVQNFEVNNVK